MSLKLIVRNLGEKLCAFCEDLTTEGIGKKKDKIMQNSLKLSDYVESIGVHYYRKHSTLAGEFCLMIKFK